MSSGLLGNDRKRNKKKRRNKKKKNRDDRYEDDYDENYRSKSGANTGDFESLLDEGFTDDEDIDDSPPADEEIDKKFSLTSGQKATQVIEILFILLCVASAIAALVFCPITFDRVNDTKNEIQTFKDVFNITDDTILEDQCGTIDTITGNITVNTQMNLKDAYLNVPHFSQGDLTDIGRIRFGFSDNSEEERAQNAILGASQLVKFNYKSGPSIGFHLGDMDDVQSRCKSDSGVGGAGNNWIYTLIDTKKTGEALIYLCYCIHAGSIFDDSYTGTGGNNAHCLNAGSERPDTYNSNFQERCIAQQFCYNWFEDNDGSGKTPPVNDYNICSFIPK